MEDRFDTDEKKSAAVAAFSSLVEHPGWKLMVQVWQDNIDFLKMQLEEPEGEQTIEDIKRLRDKLKIFKENQTKPMDILKSFEKAVDSTPNEDPYLTPEELRKSRGEIT